MTGALTRLAHVRPLRAAAALVLLSLTALAPAVPSADTQAPGNTSFNVVEQSIDSIHDAIRSGRTTCVGVVQQYLARIDAYNRRGPALNAVQSVKPRALDEARALDVPSGASRGPLHCIPVLVKDQLEVRGMPTTFGSIVFRDFVPEREATVIERLRKAGAVIIGKATRGEFALGYAGSVSGPIRNPYDPTRHANGSSGGVGSGIAASLATVGIAEDTGGSTRAPAGVTSLVGLRPTLSLVSRHGVMPSRPSADTVGPIARTARDAALVMDVIAGYDARDPVTAYAVGRLPPSFAASMDLGGLAGVRIGVIRHPMSATTDERSADFREVRNVVDRALDDFGRLGARVAADVTIPDIVRVSAVAAEGNVFETEEAINAYLSQHANAPVKTLRDILLTGEVLPWRARGLMNFLGHSTDEVGYLRVQRTVEDLRRRVLALMAEQQLDVLAYATSDHSPGLIAPDVMTNPNEGDTRLGSNRALAAILAFPAIVVPAGFTTAGLPVGLELMGRPFDDAALLRYAHVFERAGSRRRPPATAPALPTSRP